MALNTVSSDRISTNVKTSNLGTELNRNSSFRLVRIKI